MADAKEGEYPVSGTKINQVFTSRDGQNAWAHLVMDNAWHKVLTGAADGVTNVFLVLTIDKGNDR